MTLSFVRKYVYYLLFLSIISCEGPVSENDLPLIIREDPAEGKQKALRIKENTAYTLAEGLTIDLWASDSLAPDPVAMSIDDFGRVFLTSTNRRRTSALDIRSHRQWMIPVMGFTSVEDLRKFIHDSLSVERSGYNSWLEDHNKDGLHDWRDLAVEKDEVWRLEDTAGDGLADKATRIINDFNDETNEVAAALLVRKQDIFVGIAPDMWRFSDTNGDDIPDSKESIANGFGVHIGFGGHSMSGAVEGPDGKIYWGIGDIGATIHSKDGAVHRYPNQGVIVRAYPDGSDFEVFATGLRNTHEFVFDEYGNMISSDNDGDHRGESERLVHIVEGSDAGWRINWQFGKYNDPKNNSYKVWMDEGLYKPRWEGQAAFIIPPIRNFHNGPTGMAFNPGTALGSEWKNKFFIVEFTGSPERSHIWSFGLKPKGASFDFDGETDVLGGILATGIRFGPDGALYIADWINGWATKDYGRVWKVDVSEDKNDFREERLETRRRMQLDYSRLSEEELYETLFYPDMRIRQKGQFALAEKGEKGFGVLKKSTAQLENQLARIHGIWGIGQMASEEPRYAEVLISLLEDMDAEIVAQSAKVLGEIKESKAAGAMVPLLTHSGSRVRFFAAQALGRMKYSPAVPGIVEMIDANNDEDPYIRHAGVLALSRIGLEEPIADLYTHPERDVRIAAVLVLRRMQSEQLKRFLTDKEEYIVTEAARAINDDWSVPGALPYLAEVLENRRFSAEPLLRRAINACSRVGGEKELKILIGFARRGDIATSMKAEALATLGVWASPSVLDRVDGRYRGKIERDPEPVRAVIRQHVKEFLKEKDPEVLKAAIGLLLNLEIRDYNEELEKIFRGNDNPELRAEAISALKGLGYVDIGKIVKQGLKDTNELVRVTALGYLDELNISKEDLPGMIRPVFESGNTREQQQVIKVLSSMPVEKTRETFEELAEQAVNKSLAEEIILDLMEAIEASGEKALMAKMDLFRADQSALGEYTGTLAGGSQQLGQRYFFNNTTGQCIRCHSLEGEGGEVGPSLDHIGDILSREELLQALVQPSARLSPGFGSVTVTMKDGKKITGVLLEEKEESLVLRTSESKQLEIAIAETTDRVNLPSGMPPMGSLMSKRELRDVIEFLSSLKK